MRLKATLKLFFQNLSLIWKVAVYKLITYSVTILLVWLSAHPILNKLNEEGFFSAVQDVFSSLQTNISNIGKSVSSIFNMFVSIIQSNWNTLSFSIVMFIFVITFLSYFINALADVPVCEVLYGAMSCNAQFGFCSCYIKNMKRSLKYAVVKMFSAFIFDAIIFAILILLINLCTASHLLSWLAPCLAIAAVVILFAFRLVFFACFAPNIVINDYNTFASLAKGVKLGFKHFMYNYATAAGMVLAILCFNMFFALFSFGAALTLTLPATLVLIAVFDMVIFYSSTGMYYYISATNIQDETKGVKKLEQQDTIKNLKNII